MQSFEFDGEKYNEIKHALSELKRELKQTQEELGNSKKKLASFEELEKVKIDFHVYLNAISELIREL
jgi:hypothetical protein